VPAIMFLIVLSLSFTVAMFARDLPDCNKINCAEICDRWWKINII